MKQSWTNKSLQCCFLYLIYSQLRRPSNEGWCLLMLTAGDNFGLQLQKAWRMERSRFIGLCHKNSDNVDGNSEQNYMSAVGDLFTEVMWTQAAWEVYSGFMHRLGWETTKMFLIQQTIHIKKQGWCAFKKVHFPNAVSRWSVKCWNDGT